MISSFVLAALFLLLAICLFCGRGSWLIAGYNMMSEKEKAAYDQKKLCRAAGAVCLVCCVLLAVMGLLGHCADAGLLTEKAMLIFAVILIAALLLTIFIAGRYIGRQAQR